MDDLQNRMTFFEKRLTALEQEVAVLKAAQEAPRRESRPPVAAAIASPKAVEAVATPNRPPAATPPPGPEGMDASLRIGAIRLDERHPLSGEYRHLDISLFDVKLEKDHWDRIKFKLASFKGRNYLEFRSLPNWPEIFHVWPGKEADDIGKVFVVPDWKTKAAPALADPRDFVMLKALFGNLERIVRSVTTGVNAPNEEIEFWRETARDLAHRAPQILTDAPKSMEPAPIPKPAALPTPMPGSTVVDRPIQIGRIRLDERHPPTGEYRHLDISLFDAKLKTESWDRIKFKLASFKGHEYLEFRSHANAPQIFRVWPGTEEDNVSRLFKFPDAKTATAPALGDPRDLALLEALFANLDPIVREVTEGMHAPKEEIQLWRDEAKALAIRALQILTEVPKAVGPRAAPTPIEPAPAPRPAAPAAAPKPVAPAAALRPFAPAAAPKPIAPTVPPSRPGAPVAAAKPVASPSLAKPASNVISDTMQFGRIRLDERLPPTGQYRHLDISVIDVNLKTDHWDRIKFKFANFKGDNYLEFRSATGWPEAFHVWPGTEEDSISKLFKVPDPAQSTAPALADPRDRTMLKALLGNLNLIVRTVTTGLDAPNEEIELWREEARTLAARTLQML